MASSRIVFFIFLLALASCSAHCCRKIRSLQGEDAMMKESVYVHTLPKAPVLVATSARDPIIDKKLVARRVEGPSRRRLHQSSVPSPSVPSPGVGHGN
ncbi:hypothetical protein AgCh_018924 [Apium graveolens]